MKVKKSFIIYLILILITMCVMVAIFINMTNGNKKSNPIVSDNSIAYSPTDIGERMKDIVNAEEKIIVSIGDLTVLESEMKIKILGNEIDKSTGRSNKNIDESEATEIVLKQKLLVIDAEKRGLSSDNLESALLESRRLAGVDSNGNITDNPSLKTMLSTIGWTYDEYEDNYLRENLRYSLLYYEYAKCIFEELSKEYPDIVFDDEMVDNYMSNLLTEYKNAHK